MADLDVTDVLLDPDFTSLFDVVRSTTSVGSNGETALTPTTIAAQIGVVVPANSNDLKRMFEAGCERLTGAIRIITTFRLTSGGAQPDASTATADIVVWGGRRYSVFQVEDWSQFGAGFIAARAEMLSLT